MMPRKIPPTVAHRRLAYHGNRFTLSDKITDIPLTFYSGPAAGAAQYPPLPTPESIPAPRYWALPVLVNQLSQRMPAHGFYNAIDILPGRKAGRVRL